MIASPHFSGAVDSLGAVTSLSSWSDPDKGSLSEQPLILVVDDHPTSRMTAATLLAVEGYQVLEAESGPVALSMVTQTKPDLLLLDVMMPGMDGFEVCQRLKQDEHTRLIPIVFVTALNDRRSRIRGIEAGGDDFLTKPFDRLELTARVKSLVRQKRLNEDLDHAEQVLFSIARSIESRDPNTGNHCERLVAMGKAFGEFLNLSRIEIRNLMWGGYLHDIGKVGIPDAILLKKGQFTPEEFEVMKQHVLIGEKICQPLRTMRGVLPIIRYHHERWDGTGYPDGLTGDEIPFLAQVFQIIDIYDALTSERPYKTAFSPEKALEILVQETAKGWRNPELVEEFTEFICHTYLTKVTEVFVSSRIKVRYQLFLFNPYASLVMVAVAILAAGRGTRMKSTLPKVLHTLGGRSLVERVLDSCQCLSPKRRFAIVGYQAEQVKAALRSLLDVEFVEQQQQLGTGHAIQQLLPYLQGFDGDLLVLNGDVPLLRPKTLQQLIEVHQSNQNAATILTANLPNPAGYGRVFCNGNNIFKQIVEDRDCSAAQKQNHRVNAGIYCFRWADLEKVLPQLQANNDQEEYYLTDAVNYLNPVMVMDVEDWEEILGINDRKQLATAYSILQDRVKDRWMAAGVTLIDPDSITIDDRVELQPDTIIEPQTHLRGDTTIGSGCRIGPGSLIENSQIGANVTLLYSVVMNSVVADGTRIGPYAHLRGQVQVGESCRVGNFVELKNTTLGDRTNVAHLSYLGDTTTGSKVNIGAGTITANYDGVNKHPTIIGDRTKTGSNSVLVSPLTLGIDVTVAAGSVVTEDVPDDCLVIGRSRQVIKPGWRLNE